MALRQVDISGGQVSGVDDMSPAPSYVSNFEIDESGINRPRPRSASLTTTGIAAGDDNPVIGHAHWPAQGGHMILVTEDGRTWAINDSAPTVARDLTTSLLSFKLRVSGRPVFAFGDDHVYVTAGPGPIPLTSDLAEIVRWGPSMAGNAEASVFGGPLCTHLAVLGQRLIANDAANPGAFRWSDLGEGNWTTWPAANISATESRPDPVRGVYENGTELFIFGSESIQLYGLGNDPSIPFELINTLNVGTSAPYSPTRLDSEIVFLDHSRRVVLTDGRSIEPISDAIQRDIREMDTVDDCWCWFERRGQHEFIGIRFPTEEQTFVYDRKGSKWTRRDDYSNGFISGYGVNSYVYWPRYNQHTFSSTAGGLFYQDTSTTADAIVCERITGWNDFGSMDRKRSTRVRAVFRRGTAAQNATPRALELRVQNENGPWTEWKQLSCGEPHDYDQSRDGFFGGLFKRRRYHVRYSTSENMSLVGLYDDVSELAP